MNDREALLTAISDLVLIRDSQGSVIDVTETASQLLRSYPDAGLSIEEIAVHIETMGVIVGAALLTGNRADKDAA
jgi:hypothetical protein